MRLSDRFLLTLLLSDLYQKQIVPEQEASEPQKYCSSAVNNVVVRCCFNKCLTRDKPSVTAVDVWSVGVIFLFFLTGRFPIFQSNDDIEALLEIATILGKKKIEVVAILHSNKSDIDLMYPSSLIS